MFYERRREYLNDRMVQAMLDRSSKMGTFSREKTNKLVLLAQDGDEEAMELLLISNARFCYRYVVKRGGRGVEVADLFSEAMSGLVVGIERFNIDNEAGAGLLTYAMWWVNQRVLACMSDMGRTVKLSRGKIAEWSKVNKVVSDHTSQRKSLDVQTISEESGVHIEVTKALLRNGYGTESLNVASVSPSSNNRDEKMERLVGGLHDYYEDRDESEWLKKVIFESLNPREARIVTLRFWGEMTLEEIGKEFGVTRERIRQIEFKALGKLTRAVARIDKEQGISKSERCSMIPNGGTLCLANA